MTDISMPRATRAHAEKRHALAPGPDDAFHAFGKAVFAPAALDVRTKQLIAVAVAHVTQCPWCIEAHVKAASREGAAGPQIMEAIWGPAHRSRAHRGDFVPSRRSSDAVGRDHAVKPKSIPMTRDDDTPRECASPACLAHQIDPAYVDPPSVDPQQAQDVTRWRRAERIRLLAERAALPVETRRAAASCQRGPSGPTAGGTVCHDHRADRLGMVATQGRA